MNRFVSRSFCCIALAATLIALMGCAPCGEDVVATYVAPGGKHAITTYVRNCGATTFYVTHANLHLAQRSPLTSWDGAVRDGEVVTVKGNDPLEAIWLGPGELEFRVDPANLIECADNIDGVRVRCTKPTGR
jgi:hypothetical protein